MGKLTNCKACGAEIATNAKVCPRCGAKNKKPIHKRVWFWIVVFAVVLGALGSIGGDDTTTDKSVTNAKQEQPAKDEFDETEYKAIKYNNLARNPEKYKYKLIRGRGKVIQVIEGDDTVDLRIAVGEDYDKIMYVEYSKDIIDTRILEEDIVRYYGVFIGTITYTSVLGGEITVPATAVEKIVILQEAQ